MAGLDKLSWTFDLTDRMSAPASKMAQALGKVEAALVSIETYAGRTQTSIAAVAARFTDAAGKVATSTRAMTAASRQRGVGAGGESMLDVVLSDAKKRAAAKLAMDQKAAIWEDRQRTRAASAHAKSLHQKEVSEQRHLKRLERLREIAAKKARAQSVRAVTEAASLVSAAVHGDAAGLFGGIGKAIGEGIGGSLGGALGGIVGNALGGAINGAVGLARTFVSTLIDASAEAEKTALHLKFAFGEAGSRALLDTYDRMQYKTAKTDEQLIAIAANLKLAGIEAHKVDQITAAALDVEAMTGGRTSAETAAYAMRRVMSTQRLARHSLSRLAGGHVGAEEYYTHLARTQGIDKKLAEKMAKSGKFSGRVLIDALMDVIAGKEGGKLGTAAEQLGNTVAAKLMHLKNLPNEYMKAWAEAPSFKAFSDRLSGILDRFKPDSPEGKRIIAFIDRVADKMVDWFLKITSPEGLARLDGFVAKLAEVADSAWTIAKAFYYVGKAVGFVADNAFARPAAMLYTGFNSGGIDEARIALENRQPFPENFNSERQKEENLRRWREGDGVPAPTPDRRNLGPVMGGQKVANMSVTVNVDGSGKDSDQTADEVAKRLKAEFPEMTANIFDNMALEEGH